MKVRENPLMMQPEFDAIADTAGLSHPCILQRKQPTKREIRDLRRAKSAKEALAGLNREIEIEGFTKGQFSFVDLIRAALEITGPAHLDISTWTAASADMKQISDLMKSYKVESTRWLVDFSFQRRHPAVLNELRTRFGDRCIRVSRNHSKFACIVNEKWKLCILTSMNLNMNPRFEDFIISHAPDRVAFRNEILSELFSKQKDVSHEQTAAGHKRDFAAI